MKKQKYKPNLGMQGNIELSLCGVAESEDALCEIDETTSESRTEIEEALCELDEKITALRALVEGAE